MAVAAQPSADLPRPVLLGIGVLLALTLLAVGAARLAGTEPAATPPVAAVDERRALVLAPLDGGGLSALDPATGAALATLSPGADGFVRGVLRALGRIRTLHGVAADAPVELVRWSDGRHSLIDPTTGWRIELMGFGPSNFQTFAALLSEAARGDPR